MQELIDIILSVVTKLNTAESLTITRKDEYNFELIGVKEDDRGVSYNFNISIKYTPVNSNKEKE